MPLKVPPLTGALVLSLLLEQRSNARADIGGWDEEQSRSCVAALGDLDHDGVPDFALARRHLARGGFGVPLDPIVCDRVWLVSGRSGERIRTLVPACPARDFGHSMAHAGDIDGDGCADLVVGGAGSLWVHSGRTGALLYELTGALRNSAFTGMIAAGHDVDCDGVPDIAGYLEPAGVVALHSGRTGGLLRVFGTQARSSDSVWSTQDWIDEVGPDRFVSVEADRLGGALAFCSDRDDDGRAELALAIRAPELAPEPDQHPRSRGRVPQGVAVLDALDGRVFLRFWCPVERGSRPWLLAALPDMDADGIDEIALSMVHEFLSIHSGATGAELRLCDWRGGYMNGEGASFDVLGDVNGDGVFDHLIGANEDDAVDCDEGYASLRCGRTGAGLGHLDLRRAHMEEHGRPPGCGPGADVCALGDFDGDGVPDALVAIPRLDQLRVLSGRGFAELRRYSMSAIMTNASEAAGETSAAAGAAPQRAGEGSSGKD